MRGMMLIARRELGAYFNTMRGWFIAAAVLLLNGLCFNAFAMGRTARYSTDVLEDFFYYSFGFTVVAALAMSMRLLAEERQTRTMVLIDSAPLSDWQIVGGKFLSAFVIVALLTLLTLYMPALVFVNGKVSTGQIAAGYLGLLLCGAATVAIGTFGSALARDQYMAIAISAAVVVLLIISWLLGKITEPPLADVFSFMAMYDRHFQPFTRGQVNLSAVVYFLSLTFGFLMASVHWLATRRWQ